jgi:uncharacterized protein HemX
MIGKLLLGWVLKNWLWGIVVAGVLALAGGIYATGYNAAWRQAQVDTLKAKIATQQRDIDASTRQRRQDQTVIVALEAQAKEDEEQYEALRKVLAERPPDAGRGLTQSELDLLLGKRR